MKQFVVVKFLEKNGNETVESIPSAWLTPKKKNARWPHYEKNKLDKALTGKYNPAEISTWEKYPIKIMKYASTYRSSQSKVKDAQNTSNIDTSDSECETHRRKRQANERLDVPPFPSSEEVTPSDSLNKTVQEQREENMNQEDQDDRLAELDDMVHEDSTATDLSSIVTDFSSTNNVNNAENKDKEELTFQQKIFQNLESIKYELQDLRRELKNAKRGTIVKLPEGNEGISEDQAFKLPIQSEEELKNLEILLQDENIRIKMVDYLSQIGGLEFKDSTYIILNHTLSKQVALLYSFCGKKGKKSFKGLNICHVIIRAVLKRVPQTSQVDIQKRIGTYLATAGDRDGGRKRRRTTLDNSVEDV